MANIDNSIARFSASMAEINAAKKHTIIIDLPPARKAVAGKTTKVFIKKAPVAPKTQAPVAPKTAPKAATTVQNERQSIVMTTKKIVAKKSKLGKLLSSNKTVFDFSH